MDSSSLTTRSPRLATLPTWPLKCDTSDRRCDTAAGGCDPSERARPIPDALSPPPGLPPACWVRGGLAMRGARHDRHCPRDWRRWRGAQPEPQPDPPAGVVAARRAGAVLADA